jgi:EF hand
MRTAIKAYPMPMTPFLLRPLMPLCCSSRAQDQGLSPEDISALIAEHDSNKDGVIDYQEFLAMMRWVAAGGHHTTTLEVCT